MNDNCLVRLKLENDTFKIDSDLNIPFEVLITRYFVLIKRGSEVLHLIDADDKLFCFKDNNYKWEKDKNEYWIENKSGVFILKKAFLLAIRKEKYSIFKEMDKIGDIKITFSLIRKDVQCELNVYELKHIEYCLLFAAKCIREIRYPWSPEIA